MKKSILFLLILMMMVGCTGKSTTTPNPNTTTTPNGESSADTATTTSADTATTTSADSNNDNVDIPVPVTPGEFVFPATNVPEAFRVRPTDHFHGDPNYKILFIEYADFQCPACAAFYPVGKQLEEEYRTKGVGFVFRNFPLTGIHPNALKAAEASEAASVQGKFWQYHDKLYERQKDFSNVEADVARDVFIDIAKSIGLDVETFTNDLDSNRFQSFIEQSKQEAINLGLNSTPSALFEGRIGNGMPIDPAQWRQIFNRTLEVKAALPRIYKNPPAMTIDPTQTYFANVEMENGGKFVIELDAKNTPMTVNNFIFLTNEKWFDGVTFHRVLKDFVAQTGDPTATGAGGPGYLFVNEKNPTLTHKDPGVVAMANSGRDTNGSQWYVVTGNLSAEQITTLDTGYTMFGKVIEGLEVVQGITLRDTQTNQDAPPGDKIKQITIETKPGN